MLAFETPLRARNFIEMRWGKNLKKNADGLYELHFRGLEFKVVVVMGCKDSQLPLQSVSKRLADEASRATFAEQERNLFYVACTRARERLLVSCAGEPSRLVAKEKAFGKP